MVKIKNPDWDYIREYGSELHCSVCKEVLIYNPSLYTSEEIHGIVFAHKSAHEISSLKKAEESFEKACTAYESDFEI